MYHLVRLYARIYGWFIVRKHKKMMMKKIASLPRDEYGRWILPEEDK